MTDANAPTEMQLTLQSDCVEDTLAIAVALSQFLQPGDLLKLEGELGAGKTQFVRGLARGLGLDDSQVSSPTYVIMQEYVSRESLGLVLVHIDAYRMETVADVESIGLSDSGPADDEIWVIEWPTRAGDTQADRVLNIALTHQGDQARLIEIRASSVWQQVWPDVEKALSCWHHDSTRP